MERSIKSTKQREPAKVTENPRQRREPAGAGGGEPVVSHLYTPHKKALLRRTKELEQAADRLMSQWAEEANFMARPNVGLVDPFQEEVIRAVTDISRAVFRLKEYINSVPDEPVED